MKQGTISIALGCHNIFHSIWVLRAWKYLYGKWPEPWQIVCIFLHDIGHIGLNYLDNENEKNEHWKLGARLAGKLFGRKGFLFTAGHDSHSGFPQSELYKADKYSWHIAPFWWLLLNTYAEPKLRMGYSRVEAIARFKAQVKENVESGSYRPTHDLYLERCKGKQE